MLGPLVQSFAGLRQYVQWHVIDNPATKPAMAACNIDSRQFIGAVSRVIATPVEIVPGQGGGLSASAGLTRFDVQQQGPAPASTVPHLPVTVSEIFQARFNSLIELEAALTDFEVPTFVIEEHWLPPT